MKSLNKIKWFSMVTLVLSLFLPWFKNLYFSISGFEIIKFPYLIENIASIKPLGKNLILIPFLFYIVYAIPVIVLLILILYKKKNIEKYFLLLSSVPIIILFTTVYNRPYLLKFLDIGAYTALISSIIIIISIILLVTSKQITLNFNEFRVILICICFVAIFLFFTSPHPFPGVKTDIETEKTKEDLQNIVIEINEFVKKYSYPPKVNSFEELVNLMIGDKTFSLKYLKNIPLKDAWGNSFHYNPVKNPTKYILSSGGKNGKPGDSDDIYYCNL